jgi:hypothetical protein
LWKGATTATSGAALSNPRQMHLLGLYSECAFVCGSPVHSGLLLTGASLICAGNWRVPAGYRYALHAGTELFLVDGQIELRPFGRLGSSSRFESALHRANTSDCVILSDDLAQSRWLFV